MGDGGEPEDETAKAGDAEAGEAKSGDAKPGEVQVELVGRTDVGLVREHNEDALLVVRLDDASRDLEAMRSHPLGPRGTLLVVCDGMGGAAAGEVASSMAVERIAQTMLGDAAPKPLPGAPPDDEKTARGRKLRLAACDANGEIFREARANLARSGMGTTMTTLLLAGRHAVIAQVGDSRAYLWRKGDFTQVTRDQSLVNQLLETGHITPEQARFFEHSNVILQALGVQEEVEVQLSQVELRRGDRFLLCSDGLVGVVTDEEIGAVMGACDDLEECARILIEMANGAGGPDNITVIVARVGGEVLPEPTEADKVEYRLWRIDPETAPEPAGETDPGIEPARYSEPPQPRRRRSPAVELASMAVVCGLLLGSVLSGAVLYQRGVVCRLDAQAAGLAVLADGRDSGVRTSEGTVTLRLQPGHHTVTLSGQAAPEVSRDVDVASGAACEIDFAPPPAEGAAR
jgi:protein phosphatase